jgi:uncharacterized protein YdhG (YjbR/CyaY superfamily)
MFKDELGELNTSKGTVQFSLNKKLPTGLIKKMVKYRIEQNKLKKMKTK